MTARNWDRSRRTSLLSKAPPPPGNMPAPGQLVELDRLSRELRILARRPRTRKEASAEIRRLRDRRAQRAAAR